MKIVRINSEYRDFLIEKDSHFQHEGIGVLAKASGYFYFMPLKSKIRKTLPNHHEDYKYETILDNKRCPIATLEIRDYYLVDQNLINTNIEIDDLVQLELIYIRKNKKKIINKLNRSLKFSKRRKKEIERYYEEFYEINKILKEQNKKFGIRYFKEAIISMSLVEGVNISDVHIESVIKYEDLRIEIPETLDSFAIKTVINLKYAWDEIMSSIESPINLDHIININALVAKDEALEINQLRNQRIFVSGTYEILPVDKDRIEIDIQRFIQFKDRRRKEYDILDLYLYIITNQLFYDGNKRTAFLIANQLLISHGIGILIIKEENLIKFNELLDAVYRDKSNENKDRFIQFLQEVCIIRIY